MSAYLAEEIYHYANTTYNKCLRIEPFAIGYYDLTFVLEGVMVYYINGEKCVLKKNDVLFLPTGTFREREYSVGNVKYVSYNFRFIKGREITLPYHMPSAVNEEIRKLLAVFDFPQIRHTRYDHEKCLCILNALLYELLNIKKAGTSNAYMEKILSYIARHIREKITLADISRLTHLSKEYCSYLFAREMGQTLVAYINEQKMLYARELFVKKQMSRQDIADYLGFSDYNYFSRLYKKQFGYPPRDTV